MAAFPFGPAPRDKSNSRAVLGYYGYQARARRPTHQINDISFARATLAVLQRIKSKVDAYDTAMPAYEEANAKHAARTSAVTIPARKELAALKAELPGISERLGGLTNRLVDFRIGAIRAIFHYPDDLIEWKGQRYEGQARAFIKECEELTQRVTQKAARIAEIERTIQQIYFQDKPPTAPQGRFIIRDRSRTYVLEAYSVDRKQLQLALENAEARATLLVEKESKVKAKAAAYDEKQREQAKSIRRKIKHQLQQVPYCPYCGKSLALDDAHADHIYPMAHGGLSTVANMIFVCSLCNQAKKDKTLREFIQLKQYDEARIHQVLEKLRKRF